MNALPFMNIHDNDLLNICANKEYPENLTTNFSHNDQLNSIDPDLNMPQKIVCKNYDTSQDFIEKYGSTKNLALIHSNICSSQNKLNDFMYYIDHLNVSFAFIGFSETWANKSNEDLLNIPGYKHEQCIRSNKKRGGGVSIYVLDTIQYKKRNALAMDKNIGESVFIEVDKSIFKTNRNIIIGEIYKPPSIKIKCFNKELDKLLNVI